MRLKLCLTAGLTAFSLIACKNIVPGGKSETAAAAAAAPAAAKPGQADSIVAALPVIPEAKFNLKDFGGVGDSTTLNTEAFTKAVAAVAAAGGGLLIVPEGIYKTQRFALASKIDLHLEAGAIIRFPDNFKDYDMPDPAEQASGGNAGSPGGGFRGNRAALITCPPDSTDIAITGPGTIDGNGAMFWRWSDKAARNYPAGRTVVGRPNMLDLRGVKRLHIDGPTFKNSPMYHLVPRGEDITIENVRIVAPSDAPNTDAINTGGERIVVRNCEIDTGDDNVALQSGSQNVLIENLTCLHGHGISIGSGTRNGLSHIFVRNCTFDGTDNGLRIKSYRGGGGEVQDINYSDITMKNVRRPFDINMLYNGNTPFTLPNGQTTDVGTRESAGQTQNIPNFHDIHVTNLTVTRSPLAGRIIGLPELNANAITFTNVRIQADRGFLVQDGKDIAFDNVQIDCAAGEPLVLDNGTVKWNGAVQSGSSGGSPMAFYGGN